MVFPLDSPCLQKPDLTLLSFCHEEVPIMHNAPQVHLHPPQIQSATYRILSADKFRALEVSVFLTHSKNALPFFERIYRSWYFTFPSKSKNSTQYMKLNFSRLVCVNMSVGWAREPFTLRMKDSITSAIVKQYIQAYLRLIFEAFISFRLLQF